MFCPFSLFPSFLSPALSHLSGALVRPLFLTPWLLLPSGLFRPYPGLCARFSALLYCSPWSNGVCYPLPCVAAVCYALLPCALLRIFVTSAASCICPVPAGPVGRSCGLHCAPGVGHKERGAPESRVAPLVDVAFAVMGLRHCRV